MNDYAYEWNAATLDFVKDLYDFSKNHIIELRSRVSNGELDYGEAFQIGHRILKGVFHHIKFIYDGKERRLNRFQMQIDRSCQVLIETNFIIMIVLF